MMTVMVTNQALELESRKVVPSEGPVADGLPVSPAEHALKTSGHAIERSS